MTRKSHKDWIREGPPPGDPEDDVYAVFFEEGMERVAFRDFPSRGLRKRILAVDGSSKAELENDGTTVTVHKCRTSQEIESAIARSAELYPSVTAAGLRVCYDDLGPPYIKRSELVDMLKAKGKAFADRYYDLFGIQTCSLHGPYPWDVDAVLHRMSTGRLKGSQALWD